MLRRLHVLLHHRARRPHHPEPLRRLRAARGREAARYRARLHRRDLAISAAPPPTCIASRARAARSRPPAAARRCVYPGICPNLNTDHTPLIKLYRKARALPGVKKVLIASGVRYDLAVESPEYVKELAQHHVGGYLKIAPEAIGEGPLSKMMKPGVGAYYKFQGAVRHATRRKRARSSTSFRISSPRTRARPTRTCSSSRCG